MTLSPTPPGDARETAVTAGRDDLEHLLDEPTSTLMALAASIAEAMRSYSSCSDALPLLLA